MNVHRYVLLLELALPSWQVADQILHWNTCNECAQSPDDDDKPTMQYVVSHVIVFYVRSVIIIIVNIVWNTNET